MPNEYTVLRYSIYQEKCIVIAGDEIEAILKARDDEWEDIMDTEHKVVCEDDRYGPHSWGVTLEEENVEGDDD